MANFLNNAYGHVDARSEAAECGCILELIILKALSIIYIYIYILELLSC